MPRGMRRTLIGLAASVAVVVLLAALALVSLHTRTGGRWATTRALESVNAQLPGKLTVQRARLRGLAGIELENIVLANTDSREVIAVKKISARVSLGALLRHTFEITQLELVGLRADIAKLPDGTNTLLQALQKPQPAAVTPETAPAASSWTWVIDDLVFEDGAAQLRPALDAEPMFALDGIWIRGNGQRAADGARTQAKMTAALTAPAALPVEFVAAVELAGTVATLSQLEVQAGHSTLRATGHYDTKVSGGAFDLASLTLAPPDVEALAPRVHLADPLSARAHAEVLDGKATASFDGAIGGGSLEVRADADLRSARPSYTATLLIKDIAPARLATELPKGNASAEMRIAGNGWPPDADVRMSGTVSPRLHGIPGEHARFDVTLHGRELNVAQFDAAVGGATVSTRGTLTPERMNLAVKADLPDARRALRAISAQTGVALPSVTGAAKLSAHAEGPLKTPEIDLVIRATALSTGGVRVRGLSIDAHLHGLPHHARGSFVLRAAQTLLGAVSIERLSADGVLMDRQLTWKSAAHLKEGIARLDAAGELDRDLRGAVISTLTLSYPEARFQLAAPLRVRQTETLTIGPFALKSDHGNLAGNLHLGPRQSLAATLQLERLDLAHLPHSILGSKKMALTGFLSGALRAEGTTALPQVESTLQLSDGGAFGWTRVSGDLNARVNADRIVLSTSIARAGGETVRVSADLPRALQHGAPNSPVALTVRATGLDFGEVRKRFADLPVLEGRGDLQANLTGTLASPHLVGTASGRSVAVTQLKAIDLELGLKMADRRVVVTLSGSLAGQHLLDVETSAPLDALALVRAPQTWRHLLDEQVEGRVELADLELVKTSSGVLGHFWLRALLKGTPRAPLLTADATLQGATVGAVHDLGIRATLSLKEALNLSASIDVGRTHAAQVEANLDASLGFAVSGADLLARPLRVVVDVPALPVHAATGQSADGVLGGSLHGHLLVTGTAAQPIAEVEGALVGAQAREAKVGDYRLKATYREGRLQTHLEATPSQGGALLADAVVTTDLGARSLKKFSFAAAPIEATVRADQIDLAFLGHLVPRLRSSAGRLDGTIAVKGNWETPHPQGHLKLTNGFFDIVELGQLRDVGFDLSVDDRTAKIQSMHVRALEGTLDVDAETKPSRDGADFSVHSTMHRFPVQRAGQTLAFVDDEVNAAGHLAAHALNATITVPRAKITVPGLPEKKLQPLSLPPDIKISAAKKISAAPATEVGPPFATDLHFIVPSKFFIEGKDFDAELRADVQFHGAGEETSAVGEIATVGDERGKARAHVSQFGRKFDIQRGHVTFTGGDLADPRLDVRAAYVNPAALVTIAVSGSVQHPHLELTSDPPMDTGEIAFFLATGRRQGRATQGGGSVDLSAAAISAGGAYVADLLKQSLGPLLPVDVLSVEGAGEHGFSAKVGKYIGDRLFVSLSENLGAVGPNNNTREVHTEYQLGSHVDFEGTYGDRGTGGVDILFTKDF